MNVKSRLQALMDERGWTIYRVAKEADIPWSTVRNMFKRNTEPSITTLECICRGLGITLSQFFDTENQMGLTHEQRQLIEQWNLLKESDKRHLIGIIESLNGK